MLSVIDKVRTVLIGMIMAGLITLQMLTISGTVLEMLHYVLLILAIVSVINEVIYLRYLKRYFISADAEVIHQADTAHDGLTIHHYHLRFPYDGAIQTCLYDDSILSNTLGGKTTCKLMIHRDNKNLIFIDTLRRRYFNFALSLLLLGCAISLYSGATNN